MTRHIFALSLFILLAVTAATLRAEPLIAESILSAEEAALVAPVAPVAPELAAAAADPYLNSSAFRITLHWENDGTIFKPNDNHDRWYTNAAGLAATWRNIELSRGIGSWLQWCGDFQPQNTAVGVTISNSMFTPEDITATALQTFDRPYAGYWAFGTYFQRSTGDEVSATFEHIQLDLGFIGTHTATDDLQRKIHYIFDQPRPNGWSNQLTDEFTAQLYLRKKWRFRVARFELNDIPPLTMQIIPQATIAVGTVYRHLEAAVTARVGFNLPDDFGPDRLADIGSFTTSGAKQGWGGYLYTRLGGRAIEHNLFIEGSDFLNGHGVRQRPLVGEIGLGFGLHYRNGDFSFDFTYGQTYLTKEFYGQSTPASYGAFAMTLAWRY
ncbi:MAG: lipid A deacylase LpxR family protein [Phycisphaeraceae bacterium]